MANVLRKALKGYLYLAGFIFLVFASALTAVTIYEFIVTSSEVSLSSLFVRLKLLVVVSILIPLIIFVVVGFFLGVFKLLGIEINEGDNKK